MQCDAPSGGRGSSISGIWSTVSFSSRRAGPGGTTWQSQGRSYTPTRAITRCAIMVVWDLPATGLHLQAKAIFGLWAPRAGTNGVATRRSHMHRTGESGSCGIIYCTHGTHRYGSTYGYCSDRGLEHGSHGAALCRCGDYNAFCGSRRPDWVGAQQRSHMRQASTAGSIGRM